MELKETRLSKQDIFRGRIVYLHVDKVALPNGERAVREIVEHPGGVTILPVDENGMVTCVRQFRYAFGEVLLEAPAGKLEEGETPLNCAVRELSEETGLQAEEFIDLGAVMPSPGYCKERLYIYLALGLHGGAAHPDADEFLAVERHSLDELTELAMSGALQDAKTVIAVLKAKRYLEERGAER